MNNPQTILSLIGKPNPPTVLIRENQSADDIIDQIASKHKRCALDYDKFAPTFAGGSLLQVCERLYKFCRKNFKYVEESEDEQFVSSPQTLLNRGFSDCKGMALFCGGVLDALNRLGLYKINWRYRFASYKFLQSIPGHVFVVVKDPSGEIFLDPVMGSFNYHKPYWTAEDINVATNSAGKIGACGCEAVAIGDTTANNTADTIAAGASAVSAIVPLIAAGAQIISLFIKLFGNKYTTSTGVRWLTQKYQYYVEGNAAVTSDNKVDESKTSAAQTFFYAVLGVPIYDKFRLHTLMGTNPDTGQRLIPIPSRDARAKTYLQYWDVQQAGTTYDQALQAAAIAETIPLEINSMPGAWKNLPVNPAVANYINSSVKQGTIPQSALSSGVSNILGNSNIILWVVIGAVVLLLTSKNHRS